MHSQPFFSFSKYISKVLVTLLNILCTLSKHFGDIKWCRTFLSGVRPSCWLRVQASSKYAVMNTGWMKLYPRKWVKVGLGIFKELIKTTRVFRSSRPGLFCKKEVSPKFTGKQMFQSPSFSKIAGLRPATLLKKRL